MCLSRKVKEAVCVIFAVVLVLSFVSCGEKTQATPVTQIIGTWMRDENSERSGIHISSYTLGVESITFYNDGTFSIYHDYDNRTGEYRFINDGSVLVLSLNMDYSHSESEFGLSIQTDQAQPGVLSMNLDGLLLYKE